MVVLTGGRKIHKYKKTETVLVEEKITKST